MNQKWQAYLQGEGALFDKNVITGFDSTQPTSTDDSTRPIMAALTDTGVIRVTGADACTFLQAHFCNDVAALADNQTQLSGYCNPKGRLLAVFTLLLRAGDYYLLLPRELVSPVLKRLNMFAMMARPSGKQMIAPVARTAVELVDVSDEFAVIGLESESAATTAAALSLACGPVPGKSDADQRFLCLASIEDAVHLWQQLEPECEAVASEVWQLADIRAGLPAVFLSTQESLVPQMANMHLLDGVSFSKGCYPGQEIVARMQYLGKLKRRMERFRVQAVAVQPGTTLLAEGDDGAGIVVRSAETEIAGQSELLAVIKISAAESELRLQTPDGPLLERLSLPYDLQLGAESA